MLRAGVALALLLTSGLAAAHDLILLPGGFHAAKGKAVPLSIIVAFDGTRAGWKVPASRVTRFAAIGAFGERDLRKALPTGKLDRPISLPALGTGLSLIVLESSGSHIRLPATEFEPYLRDEGLTAVIAARGEGNTVDGREHYSRRAKTMILTGKRGPRDAAIATTPVGLTLEIVPERLPDTGPLPVRILFKGEPLAGATVKLTDLGTRKQVAAKVTGPDGRTSFDLPHPGDWHLNVIWSVPLTGDPEAEFETVFSSLTFETSGMTR